MKQALTIAGSDSGGGAGIQADLKTFHALGVFGASALTAITAQNTSEIRAVGELPADLIAAQMETVFDDLDIAAVKTGMLSSVRVIQTVAAGLTRRGVERLVVDPVMVSKGGHPLLAGDAVAALSNTLLPLAGVTTPNLHEAALLAGITIQSLDDMKRAAEKIAALGPRAVVVKGGHARFALAVDVLYADGTVEELRPEGPVHEQSIHGTGCTFSAAIAARLALGDDVLHAVRNAKRYITRVIRHAPAIGHGHRPGHHFYFLDTKTWDREPDA
jgi:hydroxymethylpyrimidine/phosphomethylpyrimidine kinase